LASDSPYGKSAAQNKEMSLFFISGIDFIVLILYGNTDMFLIPSFIADIILFSVSVSVRE
jgi:hypothetical protein